MEESQEESQYVEPTYLMEELPSRQWAVAVAVSIGYGDDPLELVQWVREHNWN